MGVKKAIPKVRAKKLDVLRRRHALSGLDRMKLFYTGINIVRMSVLVSKFKSAGLKVYVKRLLFVKFL